MIAVLALAAVSTLSSAQMVMGGSVEHKLSCSTVNTIPTVGMEVALVVKTRALAPENSVESVSISKRVIYPGAKAQLTVVPLISQTAYNATLGARGVKIVLDKAAMTAELTEMGLEYSCK